MRKSFALSLCFLLSACSQTALEKLNSGYDAFLETSDSSLYKDLAKAQNPHTLVISCSDSRVVPEYIFNAKAGDLFSLRLPSADTDVSAAVDYAVNTLKIKNIVILEHSDCSGLQDKAIRERGIKRLNALKSIPAIKFALLSDKDFSVSLMMFDIKTRTLFAYNAEENEWDDI